MNRTFSLIISEIRLARLNDPLVMYVFLLLAVPQGIFEATSIYIFETPNYIKYGHDLLNEPISVLYMPVFFFVIYSMLGRTQKYVVQGFEFLFLVAAVQGVRAFFRPFIFERNQYELFFSSFGALCFATVLVVRLRSSERMLAFFNLFALVHILGILFALFVHLKDAEGRLNAQNLDYGMTGFLFGIYAVYLWYVKGRFSLFSIAIPLVLLILTGSRTHLFLTLGMFAYCIVRWLNIRSLLSGKLSKQDVVSLAAIVGFVVVVMISSHTKLLASLSSEGISRILSTQSIEDIQSDNSTIGRLMSIVVGVKVLVENPLGITFSFIDLQRHMNIKGYPTFPHHNILAIYLVLGPLFIPIIYYFMRTLIRLRKGNQPYRFVLYYILLYSLVAGGCPHKLKVIFIYIFLLWLGIIIEKEIRPMVQSSAVPEAS